MKTKIYLLLALFFVSLVSGTATAQTQFVKYKKYLIPVSATSTCSKPKVIVSSDIRPLGTGEDDDIQAMVHYLSSSYRFETVGLISSPGGGTGNAATISWVIDNYNKDRAGLIGSTGRDYPTTQSLDAVVVQGNQGTTLDTYNAANSNHKGAKLIRDEVAKIVNGNECGPIYILTWGGVSDIAIALNGSASEPISNDQVANNIRVYSIGSSNTPELSEDPVQGIYWHSLKTNYVAAGKLWFIHSDVTFRGVYQNTSDSDRTKLKNKLNTFGCLGGVLSQTSTNEVLKNGDSASTLYLMNGDLSSPTTPSWGGQYTLVSNQSKYWTDGPGITSITPSGSINASGVPTPTDSIYGAWYDDLRLANGSGCVAEP